MTLFVDHGWVLAVAMLAIRTSVLLYLTPLDAVGKAPAMIRVFMAFGLSMIIVSWTGLRLEAHPGALPIALIAANELALGLAFVFGIYAVLAVFHFAGRLLDFQTGFAAAGIFNPAMGETAPLYGTFLQLLFVALFFAAGGHMVTVQAFFGYVEVIPPGSGAGLLNFQALISAFGYVFVAGLIVSFPVVVTLLLLDLGVGAMSRSMPQMNVYFLFLPLKIFIGMSFVWLMIKNFTELANVQISYLQEYWAELLVSAHG